MKQRYFKSSQDRFIWLIINLFFGFCGVYYFYTKRIGVGIIALFTANFFGFGWIINFFEILTAPLLEEINENKEKNNLLKEQKKQKEILYNKNLDLFNSTYAKFDKYKNIFIINKVNKSFILVNDIQFRPRLLKENFDWSSFEILLSDLLNIKILENTSMTTTTINKPGRTSTSTSSMVGRAVVGSLLLGPAGMAIGAVTAKKKHSAGASISETKVNTKYSLVIFIRNEEPIVFAESYDPIVIENVKTQLEDFIKMN